MDTFFSSSVGLVFSSPLSFVIVMFAFFLPFHRHRDQPCYRHRHYCPFDHHHCCLLFAVLISIMALISSFTRLCCFHFNHCPGSFITVSNCHCSPPDHHLRRLLFAILISITGLTSSFTCLHRFRFDHLPCLSCLLLTPLIFVVVCQC